MSLQTLNLNLSLTININQDGTATVQVNPNENTGIAINKPEPAPTPVQAVIEAPKTVILANPPKEFEPEPVVETAEQVANVQDTIAKVSEDDNSPVFGEEELVLPKVTLNPPPPPPAVEPEVVDVTPEPVITPPPPPPPVQPVAPVEPEKPKFVRRPLPDKFEDFPPLKEPDNWDLDLFTQLGGPVDENGHPDLIYINRFIDLREKLPKNPWQKALQDADRAEEEARNAIPGTPEAHELAQKAKALRAEADRMTEEVRAFEEAHERAVREFVPPAFKGPDPKPAPAAEQKPAITPPPPPPPVQPVAPVEPTPEDNINAIAQQIYGTTSSAPPVANSWNNTPPPPPAPAQPASEEQASRTLAMVQNLFGM